MASTVEQSELGDAVEGYASDDLVHTNSNSREMKKAIVGDLFCISSYGGSLGIRGVFVGASIWLSMLEATC